MRANNRKYDELRNIRFTRYYTRHAEGSVLVEFGDTRVICTASVEDRVPAFLKGKAQGWVTAEYGMLPRSTTTRLVREATTGRQTGRTQEIQRLIGRSLRSAINLTALGERTVTIDCDVLQADGGTRTAAITGGYLALFDAMQTLLNRNIIAVNPIHSRVAAISVGIINGIMLLDLDYNEDSAADADMNVVMNDKNEFIEIQVTAEGHTFQRIALNSLLTLAETGINYLLNAQLESNANA